jgi:hypothetical protein
MQKIAQSVLIIDQNIFCPIGASLKDLGKNSFVCLKLNLNTSEII